MDLVYRLSLKINEKLMRKDIEIYLFKLIN